MDASNPRSRIAELRKKKTRYTQQEFAEKLGTTVDTISNYERGRSGLERIKLIIDMCELLECNVSDLIETTQHSNIKQELGGVREVLRNWWKRVFPDGKILGGKEIDEIVSVLRNCIDSISLSDNEITTVFSPDSDLEKRFKFLIYDFESGQSTQYERADEIAEIIHNDPDLCARIFWYLKKKDIRFLKNIDYSLKKFVKRSSSESGSPSFLTEELALSDLLN